MKLSFMRCVGIFDKALAEAVSEQLLHQWRGR
jgi:hypothetical protein